MLDATSSPAAPVRGVRFLSDAMAEVHESTFSLAADLRRALAAEHCHADCARRCPTEALVWSNVLLLLPAYRYVCAGHLAGGLALVVSAFASLLYHLHVERVSWHLFLDKLSAIVAFAATFPVMVPMLSLLGFGFACLTIVAAFWFKKHQTDNYALYHSLWHGCIFVGQLFLTLHL